MENEIFTIKMESPEPKLNDREVALAWRNLCLRSVEKFAPKSSEIMEDLTAAEADCLSKVGLFNPPGNGWMDAWRMSGDNELDCNHTDDENDMGCATPEYGEE